MQTVLRFSSVKRNGELVDKDDRGKLVKALRELIFRDFKPKYWLTDVETLDVLKEVYDKALLGIT